MSILDVSIDTFEKSSGAGDFSPTAGVPQAVCIGIIDLGMQDVEWKGKTKQQQKMQLLFAIDQLNSLGAPKTITTGKLTVSMGETSAFRKMLNTWGITFTKLSDLVGKRAVLALVQNGDYVNIANVLPSTDTKKWDITQCVVPKYWLVGPDGQPTGHKYLLAPGVLLAPPEKTEGFVVPKLENDIATEQAVAAVPAPTTAPAAKPAKAAKAVEPAATTLNPNDLPF